MRMCPLRQIEKQEVNPIHDTDFSDMSTEDIDMPPSKRYKVRMNRLFRERIGASYLPFPEEDTFCEKIRSKLVVAFKINEFLDRREKRRRET